MPALFAALGIPGYPQRFLHVVHGNRAIREVHAFPKNQSGLNAAIGKEQSAAELRQIDARLSFPPTGAVGFFESAERVQESYFRFVFTAALGSS